MRGDHQVRMRVPVGTLRSDSYASLRPGYWVLWHGPSASSGEALEICDFWGLTDGTSCVARYLSQDVRDRVLVCSVASPPGSPACRKD